MSTVNVKIKQNPATPQMWTPYVGWVLALLEVNEGSSLPCIVQCPGTRLAFHEDEVELTDEPLTWHKEDSGHEQNEF